MKSELILRGGLGNQLFIILEAYRILESSNRTVVLNLADYNNNPRKDRRFTAQNLLPQIEADFEFSDDFYAGVKCNFSKLAIKFAKYQESNFCIPGDVRLSFCMPGILTLHIGYYQHINNTSDDISALERMSAMFALPDSNQYSNRLAVHIRRGDYLLGKHSMHGLVNINDVMVEMKRAFHEQSFEAVTLFTDSPELIDLAAFESFGFDVEIDVGGEPVNVMSRMASHAGLIASNSSFSLWAGLLGKPRYFSLPQFWMPNVDSARLGINWARRYPCTL